MRARNVVSTDVADELVRLMKAGQEASPPPSMYAYCEDSLEIRAIYEGRHTVYSGVGLVIQVTE